MTEGTVGLNLTSNHFDYNWTKEELQEAYSLAEKAAAEGDVPVGAIVVYQKRIIGRGCNRREKDQNPLAHAEMLAVQAAAAYLHSWRLIDCYLYTTLEPCLMCLAACQQARLAGVAYGAPDLKAGALSLGYTFHQSPALFHRFSVRHLDQPECGALLKAFFKQLRAQ